MKFYEFNDFGYYALIGAFTLQEALEEYKNTISDIYEEDGKPDLITEKEAEEKYCKYAGEDGETYEELGEDFNRLIEREKAHIFLMDGSLL